MRLTLVKPSWWPRAESLGPDSYPWKLPRRAANPAFWQHMVTFGVSIGLKGTLDQQSVAEVMRDGRPRRNGVAVAWPNPTDAENAERIDTRVLQAIYAFQDPAVPVAPGQLLDVFIESADGGAP